MNAKNCFYASPVLSWLTACFKYYKMPADARINCYVEIYFAYLKSESIFLSQKYFAQGRGLINQF